MKGLRSFGRDDHSCGYCGYNPAEDDEHYCDGFGHSVIEATRQVDGSGCRNCQQGMFCEKRWWLEHPGVPVPEPSH